MVEVSLTVGKLDASLALLLTKDHHLIEFPTILLPDGVQAGSIVKIRCDRDIELEAKELQLFNDVQEEILKSFGQAEPEPPVLKLRNVTQTSCVLEWEPLKLSTATIKSLSLFKNGQRLGQIPNPLINTTTKLSGLPIDTPYKFSLKLDTTAGIYYSNEVDVRTHKMTDLSGITVCLGEVDWKEQGIDKSDIERILKSINAKPLQNDVQVDTTHFVCTLAKGPQWKKAVDNNIPVVRPEWLKACDSEKRIVGVRMFYLDANNDLIRQHKISHYSGGDAAAATTTTTTVAKQENAPLPPKTNASENFDDVPLNESTPEVAGAKSGQTDKQVEETAEKLEKIAISEKEEEKQAEEEAPVVAEKPSQPEIRQDEVKSDEPSQDEDAKKEESFKEEPLQETDKDAQVEKPKEQAQPQFDGVPETPTKNSQVETPKEPQPQFDGVPEAPANDSQVEPPKEQPQPEFDGVAETPQPIATKEVINEAPKETQSEIKTDEPARESEEKPRQEETINKSEEIEENGKKDSASEAKKEATSDTVEEKVGASQESVQKADEISKPEEPETKTKTEELEIEETEPEETETKEKVAQPSTSKNKNKKKNKKNKKK